MSNQVIKVTDISGSEATLDFLENNVKLFSTKAFIGKNGITNDKREGDRWILCQLFAFAAFVIGIKDKFSIMESF